jgi:LEA14-like dessication related protein
MWIEGVVLGRAVKVLVALVVVIAVIGGLAYYFIFRGGVVNITGVELWIDPERVTESSTPVEAHIGLNNTFPVSVKIEGGSLRVILSDLPLVNVEIPTQEVRSGSSVLVVKAVIDNTLLDDFWYRHLSGGERSDLSIEGSLRVSTPIGPLDIPVKYTSTVETRIFPVKQVLNREYDAGLLGKVVVKDVTVELTEVTPSETRLKASLSVENKLKAIPLYVNWIVFDVRTGKGLVLGSGELEAPKLIAPGETDTVVFNMVLDNTKIPKLWVEHLRNRENTTIEIRIWLRVSILGNNIEIFKENPLTLTTEFKTSIFKYKT